MHLIVSIHGIDDDDVTANSKVEIKRKNVNGSISLLRPTSLNAFDIISFSQGFDLYGSGASVYTIISKLEEIAQLVRFSMKKKDGRVRYLN